MSLPHVLQAPRIVTQTSHQCWAAAYECWSNALSEHCNIPATAGKDKIIGWFEQEHGRDGTVLRPSDVPLMTNEGRATQHGIDLMASISLMRIQRMSGSRINAGLLDNLLNEGYIYCGYTARNAQGRRFGHAVVIYGIEPGHILLMDPVPGRGLRSVPLSLFTQVIQQATLGTTLLGGLIRSLDSAVSNLRG